MIVLIGESASGKSVIERELVKRGLRAIVTYTTRPMRQGETDGFDYHFVTREKFEELLSCNFFIEHTRYNGNLYGMAKEDCVDDAIVIVEPNGLRALRKQNSVTVKSFYVKISEKERVQRMIARGDNEDDIMRRIASDKELFKNIENETDLTIDGTENVGRNAEIIMGCINEKKDFM